MNHDLVSIVVPVYNAKNTIQRCLNSITSQTYSNLEIIIIDDGSTDETVNIIEKNYQQESRIVLIKQMNQGPSVARNNGINNCHRKIYFICRF